MHGSLFLYLFLYLFLCVSVFEMRNVDMAHDDAVRCVLTGNNCSSQSGLAALGRVYQRQCERGAWQRWREASAGCARAMHI